MKVLDNYRVRVLDEYNYTWDIWREVITPANEKLNRPESSKMEWVNDGGYHRTVVDVLEAIKKDAIRQEVANVQDLEELIAQLQQIEIRTKIVESKGE